MANTRTTLGEQSCLDAILGGTITEFEDDTIGHLCAYAFNGCSSLTRVDLPRCTVIKPDAFRGCSRLASANLPRLREIGQAAFSGCVSLTSIELPALESIGSQDHFYGCTRLASVVIGPNLDSYGLSFEMFQNCTSLTSLVLQAQQVVRYSNSAFTNTPIESGDGSIYVPANLVDAYREHASWGNFDIQPIAG